MKISAFLCIICFWFFAGSCTKEKGTIPEIINDPYVYYSGIVVDSLTGQPLDSVFVYAYRSARTTHMPIDTPAWQITSENGLFEFKFIPDTSYSVYYYPNYALGAARQGYVFYRGAEFNWPQYKGQGYNTYQYKIRKYRVQMVPTTNLTVIIKAHSVLDWPDHLWLSIEDGVSGSIVFQTPSTQSISAVFETLNQYQTIRWKIYKSGAQTTYVDSIKMTPFRNLVYKIHVF